ncbi:50S ribosomal protein L9 [Candidatus Uhrbacteria bacterium]|jgi:large subunit ribosomal protein L9|nr:50S ribosomal protein L9 [Candidatus Uhrbacteria bacterium]
MKVILLEDIKGKGYRGDVLEVSDGYAQNFLFPQAMGVPATPDALAKIKAQEAKAAKEAKRGEKASKDAAGMLEGVVLTLSAKTNDEGSLYAAVSAKDIASAAKEQGIKITPKQVKAHDPIKEAGTFELTAEFPGGYEASFSLIVEEKAKK